MHRRLLALVRWFLAAPDTAPGATILIRLMAGSVFFWEGVMKFAFPATLGVGRFTKLGIPAPDLTATFVGGVEIVGGTMLMLGLLTASPRCRSSSTWSWPSRRPRSRSTSAPIRSRSRPCRRRRDSGRSCTRFGPTRRSSSAPRSLYGERGERPVDSTFYPPFRAGQLT